MKKIMTLIAAIITVISCQEKRSQKELASDEVIESIKIERYSVRSSNPDSVSLSSYIVKDFNKKGNETKSVYYSTDNSIMMQFINQYENGNKTRVDWVDGQDQLVKYVKNTYDENGRLAKSESFNTSNEFQSGFIHKWKDNGRIEEKGPIEIGKEFKANAIYKYNEQDEFELLTEYDENDSLYATVKWDYLKFDDNNEWTERFMITNDTLNRIEKRIISYQKE